jgi:outer membrane receptor protein involved in Fe transport
MKEIHKWLPIALPVILSSHTSIAAGEPAAGEPAAGGPAAGEYEGIEEIVVSAQKRVSTLQDTAIAVTALDDEALEIRQIATTSDLQFSVPNMLFSKSNFEGSNIAIRGVGNSAVAESSDSGVGVHINDIYLNESRIFETEFYDMERLEILRGPQGTLYGRNTTAGVVNMITAKPTDEFEAKILIEAGDYRARKFNGMVNLPHSDRVSTRLAFYALDRDGYTENTFTGRDIDD